MVDQPPDPSGLPESMLTKVLDEFGVQWTQVTIFIGAALSSLHLTPFIDPAVWIVVTALAFVVAYVFRRQISGNFPRVASVAIVVALISITVPLAYMVNRNLDLAQEFQQYRIPLTVYLGSAMTTPLAFAILSYRKQEDLMGGHYPANLQQAIAIDLMANEFYRKDQLYQIEVLALGDETITLRTSLSYTAVNRTATPHRYTFGFVSPFNRARLINAKINDRDINIQDPDYRTERGFYVHRVLQPHEEATFEVVAEEDFPACYSENFTAYGPTTALTVRIRNPYNALSFSVESLLREKVDPLITGDVITCATPGAVLPYQGFRLHWRTDAR